MHQEILFPREKAALYPLLAQQIAALAEDSQPLSTLANASALLYEALPDINWAGFYLASGDMLHLGPFQGRTACTQIPFGRGVCGTAAATRQVQVYSTDEAAALIADADEAVREYKAAHENWL